jgi:transcriptional regulator with XRE-family HTH domain
MDGKERIIEKIIAEIDWFIIERVRELRKDKYSQVALSMEIGFAEGFIGRIENPTQTAIYSHRHINLIAKALKVKITEILPEKPLSNDLVKLIIRLQPPTKLKMGEVNYEVLKKIPLTEEEIKDYNARTLSRIGLIQNRENKKTLKTKK